MDCSTPAFPALHYHPEFTQTHVHWVGDAIQPSHPLSPPSPLALNLSQNQGLFHQVAKGLEISPSNEYLGLISFRIDWFDLLAVQGTLSLIVQKQQVLSTQPSLWSSSHIYTWPLEKPGISVHDFSGIYSRVGKTRKFPVVILLLNTFVYFFISHIHMTTSSMKTSILFCSLSVLHHQPQKHCLTHSRHHK